MRRDILDVKEMRTNSRRLTAERMPRLRRIDRTFGCIMLEDLLEALFGNDRASSVVDPQFDALLLEDLARRGG